MLSIVDGKPISDLLGRYYTRLSNTGFVDKSTVRKLLMYLFVVSYIDVAYDSLYESDYKKLDKVLDKLFSGCSCIMPYDKRLTTTSHYLGFGTGINSVIVCKPWYMGDDFIARVSEDDKDRFTENDIPRVVE